MSLCTVPFPLRCGTPFSSPPPLPPPPSHPPLRPKTAAVLPTTSPTSSMRECCSPCGKGQPKLQTPNRSEGSFDYVHVTLLFTGASLLLHNSWPAQLCTSLRRQPLFPTSILLCNCPIHPFPKPERLAHETNCVPLRALCMQRHALCGGFTPVCVHCPVPSDAFDLCPSSGQLQPSDSLYTYHCVCFCWLNVFYSYRQQTLGVKKPSK